MPIDGVGAAGGPNTLTTPQASGMDQLKALLAAGNMDAAISLLQTERIKGLDETLGLSMKRLQTRNEAISAENKKLADAQGKIGQGSDTDKANAQKAVTEIKGRIDALNADNQLEMIGTQDLISKRQQAHEMMTNILGKLAKTTDSIMGNLR